MRKRILPRLKTLLGAACATLYTRQTQLATSKISPDLEPEVLHADRDEWLFASEAEFEATRLELSNEMNTIADSLADLRETLSLIHGETPFPVEATTQTPCAIVHHDEALFDGEADASVVPAQEEISGGEGVFLFGDDPTFEDEDMPAHQQAA
ncbi:MAG: hypothetical protein AAGB16_04660 [Pseudomonadota bacterium]